MTPSTPGRLQLPWIGCLRQSDCWTLALTGTTWFAWPAQPRTRPRSLCWPRSTRVTTLRLQRTARVGGAHATTPRRSWRGPSSADVRLHGGSGLADGSQVSAEQLRALLKQGRDRPAEIGGELEGGEVLPLCRLRYAGSASLWGFAIYLTSRNEYQDSALPSGLPIGEPEEALDCACGLYLDDPNAWQAHLPPASPDPG